MKTIIALAASLAFAGSAFAAISSAPVEKRPPVKITGALELAAGGKKYDTPTKNGKPNQNRVNGKASYND